MIVGNSPHSWETHGIDLIIDYGADKQSNKNNVLIDERKKMTFDATFSAW